MKITFLFAITLLTFQLTAQKIQTQEIKTSAECGMCKDRIEDKLNYTKGVVFAELTVDTKILKVRFNTKKIIIDEIKNMLSEMGYNADEVKAVPSAVAKLPKCCQPGGMGN